MCHLYAHTPAKGPAVMSHKVPVLKEGKSFLVITLVLMNQIQCVHVFMSKQSH